MNVAVSEENIKGLECKHAVYRPSQQGGRDDLLIVKENIHTKDGKVIPNVRLVKNYERNFWVTKPGHRKHTDKKEWEDLDRVQKFTTTQRNLINAVAKAVGRPGQRGSLRMFARSPYLYGVDITTPVLLKRQYLDQFPDCQTTSSVAVLDIETDVVHGTGDIITVSLTFRDKAVAFATKKFMGDIPGPEDKVQKAFTQYLGQYQKERNINLEFFIAETPAAGLVKLFERAHEWMPDFITFWNIDFDMPRILNALEREGYDPAHVLSDPRVPPEFRMARYIQGPSQKVTATGKVTPLHPADRWHNMDCSASFYFIDAMCVYKKIRVTKGNEASYSLDYILNKNLGVRKLRFEKADGYSGLKWHEVMQSQFKIEYVIYNLFDCISVELLDEKTGDLSKAIGLLCEHSEYSRFPSQPRRLCDDLHFYCLKNGKVIASTSDEMRDENDQYVLGMEDWIVTLPSHMVYDNGLKVIRELPEMTTYLRAHVADLDCVSTYPMAGWVMNISKETTFRELCRTKDIPEFVQRRASINMTGGSTNALEICNDMLGYPKLDELLDAFEKETDTSQSEHATA